MAAKLSPVFVKDIGPSVIELLIDDDWRAAVS